MKRSIRRLCVAKEEMFHDTKLINSDDMEENEDEPCIWDIGHDVPGTRAFLDSKMPDELRDCPWKRI